ncbi:MAG: V-type ATP synthase subunit I [Thermoplasmataceae archaeon]
MALRPEKMLRIRIIGSNEKRDRIVSALHDAGVVQIEQVGKDIISELTTQRQSETYRTVNTLYQKFRGFLSALPPVPVNGQASFNSLDELISAANGIKIEADLKELKAKESDLLSEIKEIGLREKVSSKLAPLKCDLSVFSSTSLSSYLLDDGEIDDGFLSSVRSMNGTIIKGGSSTVVITVPPDRDAELARAASTFGLRLTAIPRMEGLPEDYLNSLKEKKITAEKTLSEVQDHIRSISSQHYEKIAQITEALEIENRKLEVSERLLSTKGAFVIEGWVPERHYGSMVRLLEEVAENQVVVHEIKTDAQPPTMLSNPRRFKIFEFFVRFYSLPQEYEIDPTIVFGIIFPVFFAIMVGDWGYGLVIFLASLWLVRKLEHPGSRTIIPKSLSRFALTIFGRGPLTILGKTLMVASIGAIVVGLLFNSFFGFPLLPITVFEMTPGFYGAHIGSFPPTPPAIFPFSLTVPKLLLFTGYIGLAMVTFGLILGMINEIYRSHMKGMVSKIGWILIAWGFAIFGLNLIHRTLSFNFSVSPSTPISVGMIVAGVGIVVAMERATGAIEVLSIISHILSYTRILGILLASVILSEVIDLIFLKGVAKSPLFAVVGVIILILGQMFNIVIAVFEPGIQGARLLYVEFFSKFYRGNGQYFRPFGSRRRYTTPTFSLENQGRKP